jgi:hypothetical protein
VDPKEERREHHGARKKSFPEITLEFPHNIVHHAFSLDGAAIVSFFSFNIGRENGNVI